MESAEYARMRRAEDAHWWYAGLRALAFERLARHAAAPPRRVLDAGCGTGGMLDALRAGRGAGGIAFGIDIAAPAIAACRARGLARLARASADALPFPAGAFDAVLCLDVLYHRSAGPPARALAELARVLARGGLLAINVPACDGLRAAHDAAIHTAHRFTRSEVRALIGAAGLELAECTHWNTLLFPAAAFDRLLHRRGARSDLERPPGALQQAVGRAALAAERALLRRTPLPFGLSILALARKPGSPR